jgi:hypothetical protein
MSINVPRGKSDETIELIMKSLRKYESDHPRSKIDLYRQSRVSIRIRIIDPDLAGRERSQRHERFWSYLNDLPEEVQSDISSVLLLTPEEAKGSFANMEFDDPVPSQL